jgi:two-component system CheB/CheR fusion protein
VLYELGFKAAVEWLAKYTHHKHGIPIEVESIGRHSNLDNELNVILFQVVRELLFNIVKHAHATMVKITIINADDKLQVIVADNGVGFDPAQNDPQNGIVDGFGLFSIRERLKYFKGGFEIDSEPGHGTRATISISLNNINKQQKHRKLSKPAKTANLPI